MQLRLVAAVGLVFAVVAAGPSNAAIRDYHMGLPAEYEKQLGSIAPGPKSKWFYPWGVGYPGPSPPITIRVGDSLRFLPNSVHNVEIPKVGRKASGAFATSGTTSGVHDEAGALFWFNGQPLVGIAPALTKSKFGRTVSFDGSKTFNSGLPTGDKPKPLTIKFTNTGLFKMFCSIHPGMRSEVRVRSRRARTPSKDDFKDQFAREFASIKRIAKALTDAAEKANEDAKTAPPPNNTVQVGISRSGVDFMGMVPDSLTVPVGSTVNFRMRANERDFHTVTFGPGDPKTEPSSYLGALAASFRLNVFDSRASYPSEPPGSTATLTPSLHGNGFWNSGIMDGAKNATLPSVAQVRFGEAGTYRYVCLRHPSMKGTVIVQ